jgi:uncharacterized protein YjbJ (UPF0337 family)
MSLTDKVTGRVKKAGGDLAGDDSLRREGRQEECKGEAKDELARDQARADRKAEEVANLERKTLRRDAPTPDGPPRLPPGLRRLWGWARGPSGAGRVPPYVRLAR